jgi:DNA helicase-2/ATP-dependent DNA helicase PcrA
LGIVGVSAATFHSAALSQLKNYWVIGGQTTDFPNVLAGRDQYFALRNAISRSLNKEIRNKGTDRKVDTVLHRFVNEELTMLRSRMIELDDYDENPIYLGPKGDITKKEFVTAIRLYEDFKKNRNLIDYADSLIRCARMIENVPHVAEEIRKKYQHFLVDEYQDNDPVQERLLRAWLGGRRSICVVGDPRQTIFSFKGADPRIMRDFQDTYVEAITVELTQNYRSTKNIVEWANRIMRNTTASGGAKSELNSAGPYGWTPEIRSYYTEKVEMEQTAVRIKQMATKVKLKYGQIAVLLRFRDDVAKVRRSLSMAGIPSVSPNDEFWRDVEPVLKGMRKSAFDGANDSGQQCLQKNLEILGWMRPGEGNDVDIDEYAEIGQILLEITSSIERVEELSVIELLEEYKRLENDGGENVAENAVNVMTLHQSKGLEWDAVFIPRFVEGALPTSHAKTLEQVDEERRLTYVGITRARKYLEISWGESYKYLDKTRSQSVSSFEKYLRVVEIPKVKDIDGKTEEWNRRFQPPSKKKLTTKSLLSYKVISGNKDEVGSKVEHPELGEGSIVAVNSKYVIIDFGKEGKFELELPPYE